MNKIEQYNEAKGIAQRIAGEVTRTLGRDSPNNDKHSFYCRFAGMVNAQWSPMSFQIECAYGYYGSSSGYSATSEDLGKYLAMAIKMHKSTLLDCAAKLAADDAEKARKAAEDEAKQVLAATS